jgi:tetratricopeptide (TPR) repeat protein
MTDPQRVLKLLALVSGLGMLAIVAWPAMADDRAVCQDQAQPPAEAIVACSRLIDSEQVKGEELAGIYMWRGWHFTSAGQHDRAIADYTEALRLNARLAGAYRERGASLERTGDLARAAEDFRQALTIDPRLQDVAEALRRVEAKLATIDAGVNRRLGLDLANLTQDLRARYKINDSIKGVVIVGVDARSVAAEKRLAAGEVIIEVGREPVSDLAQVYGVIGQLEKNLSSSVLLLVSKADGEIRYLALPME